MFILFILGDNFSCDQVKLDMKSVLRALTVLELLHFVSLLEPAFQDSTHTLHSALGQLMSPTLVIINPPVPASTITTHDTSSVVPASTITTRDTGSVNHM